MLTGNQLDALADPIVDLFETYHQTVLNDIARRLAKMPMTSTAAWQLQRLTESGLVYKTAIRELSKITGKSERELRDLFKAAGVKSMRFDDSIYKAAGLNPLPLNLSPAMAQVLRAGLDKTGGLINNLTRTTAFDAQQKFIRSADLAYMQITTGVMSHQQAVRMAIKNVGSSGLEVTYPTGHKDKLDVAMRRTVLTGVAQTSGQLQITRADEMGADLVQVSAHIGARPSHAAWQGQIFSRSGAHRKYPDFRQSTGYGTGPGLMGYNCRHSFFPFFEGLSENAYNRATLESYEDKTVRYNGEQLSFYDATQEQRAIERKIRAWKRQRDALAAGGLENAVETAKVKQWQATMRDFIRQTGLRRQSWREAIIGVTPRASEPPAVKPAPAPKPAPKTKAGPGPAGMPVSDALDTSFIRNKALRKQIELALQAVNQVHGDGDLPRIPIERSSSRYSLGGYWSRITEALRIHISTKSKHQGLTLIHEIGHFLDHRGFGLEHMWSSTGRVFNGGVVAIAKQSKWYKEVWQRFEEVNVRSMAELLKIEIPREYVDYLLDPREMFARAYAQYIAVKSGNKELLKQLKDLQASTFSVQWTDDDFEPILTALDQLFTAKGWIQ